MDNADTTHKINFKVQWARIFLTLVLTLPSMAYGLEIQGKVVEVEGSRVKIAYESEFAPQKGDEVQIGFEIPGEGFIPVEGSWEVRDVNKGYVWAEPKEAGSEPPPPDYTARILSPNPQKKSEIISDNEKLFRQAKKYDFGEGVKRDVNRAIGIYKKAAARGYVRAQYRLGNIYSGGEHRPSLSRSKEEKEKDHAEALKWYLLAGEAGDFLAQKNLGYVYVMGLGVRYNLAEAEKWYRRAEANWPWKDSRPLDDFASKLKYGALAYGYMTMPEVERKAIELYRESAKSGSQKAQKELQRRGLKW